MIVLAAMAPKTPESDDIIARWATADDRADCARRATIQAQYDSLLGRAGLRALLDNYTSSKVWFFGSDARGKLSVVDAAGKAGPAVCLSHTRGMIACAVGHVGAIGIDVETHRPRAFVPMAEFAFGVRERQRVIDEGATAFYRIWTLREAIGKATGEGLIVAMDGQERVGDGPAEGIWRQRLSSQDWLLGHFNPTPGISMAVACLLDRDIDPSFCTMRWVNLTEKSISQAGADSSKAGG
jgi:4'-phosphopantetheinyl transferase